MFGCVMFVLWMVWTLMEKVVGYLRDIRDELQRIQSDTENLSKRA